MSRTTRVKLGWVYWRRLTISTRGSSWGAAARETSEGRDEEKGRSRALGFQFTSIV